MNLFKYVAINFIIAGTVFAEANTQHQEQLKVSQNGDNNKIMEGVILQFFLLENSFEGI